MNVQYLNPFLAASFNVLETVLGRPPVRGEVRVQTATFPTEDCNVICGVTGQVNGQVIYGMSLGTAEAIASAMLGSPVPEFDELAASAIAELGNMISGGAMQHLSEAGLVCDITPPSLLHGDNLYVSTLSIPAIVMPLTTAQGVLTVTIGLQERRGGARA